MPIRFVSRTAISLRFPVLHQINFALSAKRVWLRRHVLGKMPQLALVIIGIVLPMPGHAQISGSGSANQVAKFTGASTIGNSAITETGGKVGVNTTTPTATLDVAGGLLHVWGLASPTVTSQGAYLGWNALTGGSGETDFINNPGAGAGGFAFMNTPASGTPRSTSMFITGSGMVGIGTTTPSATLSVNGSLNVSGLPYLGGLLLNYEMLQNPQGPGPTYYKIATLPASSVATLDHLHLVVTLNSSWSALQNSYLDATFANRNGFAYSYTLRGAPVANTARLAAYENSDTSVDVYINLSASAYGSAGYTILENNQETVYSPPMSSSTVPSGTVVFDSSNSTYQPVLSVDYSGTLHFVGSGNSAMTRQGGYLGWNALTGGTGETDFLNNEGAGTGGFAFMNIPPSGSPKTTLMFLNGSGNLGIGTNSPGAKLEINGGLILSAGSGGSITFADGTVQSTAANGVGGTCGGDYAESVNVSGSPTTFEPGDVLILDTQNAGKVVKSTEAYSTTVAGIYSTKPGIVGRRQIGPKGADEVPMAMVGIVPAKVSTENGAVQVGDLLVSSRTPGYAMKGTDRDRMLGAVIGKAMSAIESGTGIIEVLVTLQ